MFNVSDRIWNCHSWERLPSSTGSDHQSIEFKFLSLTYKVLTTSQPDYPHNLISVQSTGRTRSSSVVTPARQPVSSSLQITNRSFTMHHLTCGISSLLHSVNLILFAPPGSPHHSHHFCSHHLLFPRPFTPDLKLNSFTNPFLHSHSYSFWTAFTDLNLYWIKGALAFVCFSFWLRVLD